MRQLAYISYGAAAFTRLDLKKLLDQARLSNRQAFVTGLLLVDGTQFLQVLEGEASDVAATFKRICADARHSQISILSDRNVANREFGHWAMAANVGEERTFSAKVAELVNLVTCPSLKAKFSNFADYA